MKYCEKCGASIEDEASFCPSCGERTDRVVEGETVFADENDMELLGKLIKIFAIIATVLTGFAIIPLLWTIPMTVHACKVVDEKGRFSIAFAIVSCFFLSTVSGIMMIFYRRKF